MESCSEEGLRLDETASLSRPSAVSVLSTKPAGSPNTPLRIVAVAGLAALLAFGVSSVESHEAGEFSSYSHLHDLTAGGHPIGASCHDHHYGPPHDGLRPGEYPEAHFQNGHPTERYCPHQSLLTTSPTTAASATAATAAAAAAT